MNVIQKINNGLDLTPQELKEATDIVASMQRRSGRTMAAHRLGLRLSLLYNKDGKFNKEQEKELFTQY